MSNSNSCDKQLYFSGLTEKISESLTDIEWIVLERRIIYGDTLESIGATLGAARSRVSYTQNKALDGLIRALNEEIDCFSLMLEKLLSEVGGTLTVEECFTAFPEINETDFNILFAACQKKREGLFHREKELILLKVIQNIHV